MDWLLARQCHAAVLHAGQLARCFRPSGSCWRRDADDDDKAKDINLVVSALLPGAHSLWQSLSSSHRPLQAGH